MYVGKIVERAETAALFSDPKHPYTEGLLESIPRPDPEKPLPEEGGLEGELPDPADPPSGCYFHPRCAYAEEICRREEPPLEEIAPGRQAACHFANTLNLKGID
jgi:peptide/nickel transport system ATP-binding protein